MCRLGLLIVCSFLACSPAALIAGGIPAKTLKELKAATVYIQMQFQPMNGKPIPVTGSGFVAHAENGVIYIATNNHVVNPLAGELPQGLPKVVFHSGTPDERTVEAQVVARDPLRDLAILKITGARRGFPSPIPLDLSVEVLETVPVFAVGFPFGGNLALGKTNPAVTITKGVISSLRYDEYGLPKLVQIDAEINPGNSGGPVVDEKGRLVGVAVSKFIKTRTVGFAIPLKHLEEMLKGKLAAPAFDTQWVVKDQAEVTLDAGLIDPLAKLADPALHYRLADEVSEEELKAAQRANKDGHFALLKGATTHWLKLLRNRAQGRFSLKGAGQDKVRIAYQTSCVAGDGTTVYSPASVAVIDFTKSVFTERLQPGDPKGPDDHPEQVFTQKLQVGKYYIFEMRADPKHLDPRLIVRDSAGKALAEDDGSGGLFDAIVAFSPPKAGDYQIVATATKGHGPFTLVSRVDSAKELGDLGGKPLTVPAELRPSDPIDRVSLLPHQAFNFVFRKGKSYVIDAKSKEFDPYLRLENMANVALKNEDLGGGGHSTMQFSPLQDGIYRLVAMAYDSRAGRFEVSIRELPPANVHEVGPGGLKLSAMLSALDPVDIVNGREVTFRCKVFLVKLTANLKYQIDLTSNQFDPVLRIENSNGKELAFDDDSGGFPNARLMFVPPASGVYRIVARQFDFRVGAFELAVKEVK